MRTTQFGSEIIKAAEYVLGMGYRSNGKNYFGERLEEVIRAFDSHDGTKYWTGRGRQQPDYCAITASLILDKAFKNYNGTHNTIRHAAANKLADLARSSGVRVDGNPAVGSLFIYQRNAKGQGHIGFVWKVNTNNIETIEGNTESGSSFIIKDGCATKLKPGEYGILTRQRRSPYVTSAGYRYSFIHIEELYGTDLMDFSPSVNYLADSETYCDLINPDDFDFGGSDGEAPDPVELSFLEQHKDKLIYGGCFLSLILLGIYNKFKN